MAKMIIYVLNWTFENMSLNFLDTEAWTLIKIIIEEQSS